MLSQGNTTGIFQLESEGIRNVLKRLKPQHFEDIVAVTSLYRPGPMEEIPTYIARRHAPGRTKDDKECKLRAFSFLQVWHIVEYFTTHLSATSPTNLVRARISKKSNPKSFPKLDIERPLEAPFWALRCSGTEVSVSRLGSPKCYDFNSKA